MATLPADTGEGKNLLLHNGLLWCAGIAFTTHKCENLQIQDDWNDIPVTFCNAAYPTANLDYDSSSLQM